MDTRTTEDLLALARDLIERGRQLNGDTPMVVATSDERGDPNARFVLLKEIDPRGFVFFTNTHSVKGRELDTRPRAALVFYWPELGVQLRVQGAVERVAADAADAYWRTRARESQLAALASNQSATLKDRSELEDRFETLRREWAGKDIPRPAHWTGYRVVPERVETWRTREHRLHERELYLKRKGEDAWTRSLLSP